MILYIKQVMPAIFLIRLVVITLLLVTLTTKGSLHAADGFPLRNSNFKWCAGFWLSAHRQDWTSPEGLKVLAEPDAHRDPTIKTAMQMYGGQWLSQDARLIPGTYELSVEVQVDPIDGGLVRLIGAGPEFTTDQGPTENGGKTWTRIQTNFVHTGHQSCNVKIQAVRGSCRIRNPRIDVIKLDSNPVPVANGQQIGEVRLPNDPTEAEAYAAWELQYFLWKMTGCAPGVKGRDAVASGSTIEIGRVGLAHVSDQLQGKGTEGYVVNIEDDVVRLSGNTPRGTLYAVYDFLKTQGCRWLLPGKRGEVIPKRGELELVIGARTESPDWDVRGFLLHPTLYGQRGEVINVLGNDYFDWAVRNRINAVWHGSGKTHDLGAHRGGSHLQRLNHAWFSYLPKNPPIDWAPLINGKREFWHPAGRPNMICTSNQGYRDRVVSEIIKYFDENPNAVVAACSADDEPAGWCQCERCRSQDSDRGEGPWELQDSGHPKLAMTDRALNFVNEVAERVSRVHPDKQIEMYAYASTGPPPTREKVHPNVLVKITYFQVSPVRSLFELHPSTKGITENLNRWQAMGAKTLGLYDYGSFNNIDCPAFWFFLVNNHLKALNQRWGIRHYLGETDNTIGPSMMLFNIRAQSLWNRKTNYDDVLQDICKTFYGNASQSMLAYYRHMHSQMLKWELPEGHPTPFVGNAIEYELPEVVAGQHYIDAAREENGGDALINSRLNIAEFGHLMFTHYIATRRGEGTDALTLDSMRVATKAHEKILQLWGSDGNYVIDPTRTMLSTWRPGPVLLTTLVTLPSIWEFKTDPDSVGIDSKWFQPDNAPAQWSPIRTDNFWTRQMPWNDYRGTAWYRIKFSIPTAQQSDAKSMLRQGKLRLFFGAIDGRARFYLDGKPFAEQLQDPAIMWNKAFAIEVPEMFDVMQEHELVIQVTKERFAAGIWKPVIMGHVEVPE